METKKALRAIVITPNVEIDVDKEREERGVPREEVWEQAVPGEKMVKPPFDLFSLSMMPERNSELGQCIEAMCTNISGFGFQLVGQNALALHETPPDVEAEWEDLDEFITYGDWNGDSHGAVRRLLRKDVESTGVGFLEMIQTASGDIIGYNRVPSYQMRIGVLDNVYTVYTDFRAIGRGDNRRVVARKRRKRFRRYIQLSMNGSKFQVVWFKELGDPRNISAETGEVLTQQDIENGAKLANPMVYFRIPCIRSVYGLPRYIANTLAILGGRSAEQINYVTIRNNNIPSMIITVANGQLTDSTIARMKEFSESIVRDVNNYSRFLIVEADPDQSATPGAANNVKIDVTPVAQLQKDDAMFQKYEDGNAGKVRRSYRLPEVFVGSAGDYTANNVEASKRIADEQVFAPERAQEDWMWTRILLYRGAVHHTYKSNGPNVTDDADVIAVMAAAERSGAMTPRRATQMVEEIMGRAMAPLDESVNLDVPFSMQMADAVKNQAAANEVGQQVTALKSLTALRDAAITALYKSAVPGVLPALDVPADQVAPLMAGEAVSVSVPGARADIGQPLYIIDGPLAIAVAKVLDASQEDGVWQYTLADVLPIEPRPWVSIGAASGAWHDSVKLG